VDITVGESVVALAGDRHEFIFQTLGRFRLVGKSIPMTVHTLVGGTAPPRLKTYEGAFEKYCAAKFPEALEAFEEFLEESPDNHAARHYAEECRRRMEVPPEGSWDGVHVSQSK